MTDRSKPGRIIHDESGRPIHGGSGWVMLACAVLCLAAILVSLALVASGCGGPSDDQTAAGNGDPSGSPGSPAEGQGQPDAQPEGEPITYPSSLSSASSPREVVAVLMEALDKWDNETLVGLADAEEEAKAIDAIHKKYGSPSETSVRYAAGITLNSWRVIYKAFEEGASRIIDVRVEPAGADGAETALVTVKVIQPEIPHPRYATFRLVRRDGLWKVRAGLEVTDAPPSP